MTFEELRNFLLHGMSMSHIYQPLVIRILLEHGGEASIRDIASEVLAYDEAQIEYYCKILKRWPKITLTRHRVIDAGRRGVFRLTITLDSVTVDQRNELIQICNEKINDYISKYEGIIGDHRYNPEELSSGSIRYLVLKLARGRCALCGASVKDTPIDVDHIIPVNKGGTNDLANLQALCYRCNRTKRDRDAQDFRSFGVSERVDDCSFCHLGNRVIEEYNTSLCIRDTFPVTNYHSLIIPRRHVIVLNDLTMAETGDLFQLAKLVQGNLQNIDKTITAFNLGINQGVDAGQTISHLHLHLIPRRQGDVSDPRGGVRAVIPGSAIY